MTITVVAGGTAPLVRAVVSPRLRQGQHARFTYVRVNTTGNARLSQTGTRFRSSHLISLDSSPRRFQAAVRDVFGVWSELSPPQQLTVSNYSPSTGEASIGSGSTSQLQIEEPAIAMPKISMGSGHSIVDKIAISERYASEVRRFRWPDQRYSFAVIYDVLGNRKAQMLHKLWKSTGGPRKPFWFEYTNLYSEKIERYAVRFRENSLSDETFDYHLTSTNFQLMELSSGSFGGEL